MGVFTEVELWSMRLWARSFLCEIPGNGHDTARFILHMCHKLNVPCSLGLRNRPHPKILDMAKREF